MRTFRILLILPLFWACKEKKVDKPVKVAPIVQSVPYKDSSINIIYNLLFCDDLNLYQSNNQQLHIYPFDVLFSPVSSAAELQKIIRNDALESRIKILACNKIISQGKLPEKKELLGVIVEINSANGLDVLATYEDGTVRYINYTGKVLIWEAVDSVAKKISDDVFVKSRSIVSKIGPWDKAREPHPTVGNTRITFLVSDGLYFGEGPTEELFNDPVAGPALASATSLLQFLVEKSENSN